MQHFRFENLGFGPAVTSHAKTSLPALNGQFSTRNGATPEIVTFCFGMLIFKIRTLLLRFENLNYFMIRSETIGKDDPSG